MGYFDECETKVKILRIFVKQERNMQQNNYLQETPLN